MCNGAHCCLAVVKVYAFTWPQLVTGRRSVFLATAEREWSSGPAHLPRAPRWWSGHRCHMTSRVFNGTVVREGSPVTTEALNVQTLLRLPQTPLQREGCTPPQRQREVQSSATAAPDTTGCALHSVCSDSLEAGAWTTLITEGKGRELRLSTGSLLVKWLQLWSFLCPWLQSAVIIKKRLILVGYLSSGLFSCKGRGFLPLLVCLCPLWRVRPAGFSVIQSTI